MRERLLMRGWPVGCAPGVVAPRTRLPLTSPTGTGVLVLSPVTVTVVTPYLSLATA